MFNALGEAGILDLFSGWDDMDIQLSEVLFHRVDLEDVDPHHASHMAQSRAHPHSPVSRRPIPECEEPCCCNDDGAFKFVTPAHELFIAGKLCTFANNTLVGGGGF
jgi:hypothetical protein